VANSFYLDASALAKRYVPERGSPHVHALLDTASANRLYLLNIGAGEVVSILVRKRNAGVISAAYFGQALVDFEREILHAADINKLSVTNRLAWSSFPLIIAHSINSTDAVTLKSALAIARRLRPAGDGLVLVASDQRLLRAAQAEGLNTFNPEIQDHAALAAFLGP
jgi:predicted nucleic acid-binding protein